MDPMMMMMMTQKTKKFQPRKKSHKIARRDLKLTLFWSMAFIFSYFYFEKRKKSKAKCNKNSVNNEHMSNEVAIEWK
jgi:hypothetical protein